MPSKRFSRQFRKFRKPLPERNRARAKQSLCSNCKTPTPRYSPGTPRACRERPFSYHGNPRIDRWSHRSIARLCRASLMTRLDREKKNTSTFASKKRSRTPTPTPPTTTRRTFDRPPSTRPHDLRASPDDEAKHAFRGTWRGTCDDRSESERERSGEFESRSKAAETRRSSKSSRALIRLDRADRMTSASSRASARRVRFRYGSTYPRRRRVRRIANVWIR